VSDDEEPAGKSRMPRSFAGADLRGEDLREAHLAGADLTGAKLVDANLHGVDLRGSRLRETVLDAADLRDAQLDGADLSSASLRGARLAGSRLRRADLTLADLRDAKLRYADLSEALLTDANLTHADLSRAILTDADLIGAALGHASFRHAVLSGANLREAHLDGTDFTGARFAFTVLAASDVSRAVGLASVRHDGPSTVGIDAFLLSRGEIPDAFLAGIGMSSIAIEYMKSVAAAEEGMLVGDAIFLLFADADRARARRLRAYLRMHRRQAWYWHEVDELAGRENPDRGHRVRFHDQRVVLLSPAAAGDAAFAATVARWLAGEANEKRESVAAIRLGARHDEPSALDRQLAKRIVADFRGVEWEDPRDPVFARELGRLLSRLSEV
jgi:hypothetical protein